MKLNHSLDMKVQNKLKNTLHDKENVVIYGAASGGLRVLNTIEMNNIDVNVLCLVDSDISKQGSSVNGIPVKSPNTLDNISFDRVLIAVDSDNNYIEQELNSKGITSYVNVFQK